MKVSDVAIGIFAVVVVAGMALPAHAQAQPGFPQVPATLLADGVDDVDDPDDAMSSPDADLQSDAWSEFRDLVEIAVDQEEAERLWNRHGAPGAAPLLAAHHVLAAVRIEGSRGSPCHRRRFDAAGQVGSAVDLVLPSDDLPCSDTFTEDIRLVQDVYLIDLDVSDVSPEVELVRVSTAFGGGGLQYVAETAVELPVAPRLPRTGRATSRLMAAMLVAVGLGWMLLGAAGSASRGCVRYG